ncbi:SDR family NAD(P)-dependent oxidoreductase [Paraburkholderia terrae]|uniref:SDR family NAD(P)-dependent oxidoreductase n=1 Tax=Paraburkholderia terrae TaxID=311230 RepID=UPI00206B7BB1|nr:SDR family oxidoreductase [Paraburkholderia terrae]BDC45921.1 oxidoreductase [Paraburkholderia terrae]
MNFEIDSFRADLFAGKHVLVSGATSGIGLAIASAFHRLGAHTIATGSSTTKLGALRDEQSLAGIRFAMLDVRNASEISAFVGDLARLDVLVNAAGIARPHDEYQDEVFSDVLDVNLRSVMRLSQAARPLLEQTRGSIVNIASMLSYLADADVPAYCASKTGVVGLTRSLAHEYGRRGVRVNAIAPGYHRTDMTRIFWESDDLSTKIVSRTALGRWGEVDDLVGAAVFLASAAATFVTGVTLPVDGGYVSGF